MRGDRALTLVGQQLANPPLVEAVCEFRFHPSDEWDWTLPGRLYDRIQGEFPRREKPALPEIQHGLDRVIMSREDGSALVQVGENDLIINHRSPYPGWKAFFSTIERVLKTYLELVPSSLQRVGLRYVNQIPAPLEGEISKFITLDPPIPPAINRTLNNFYQRYELSHDDLEGILVHQTGMQWTSENELTLMLDLDFGSLPNSAPDVAEVERWLQAAHHRVEEAFLASINPELLNKMKGGTND